MAVSSGLLGCAADVDGAEDRAILIVENGKVRLRVTQDIKAAIVGVVEVPVRISLYVDLSESQRSLSRTSLLA